jgi:uncharacterized MAPEG superfamily protein
MSHSIFFHNCTLAIALVTLFACMQAEAARQTGGTTRTNVNRSAQVNHNVNVNRNVNVDVDRYDDYHPFATAAAVTAGVALTSAVIGSIAYSLPPSCSAVVVSGFTYQQCGSTWYQPQYAGSQVTYVVVNPPM